MTEKPICEMPDDELIIKAKDCGMSFIINEDGGYRFADSLTGRPIFNMQYDAIFNEYFRYVNFCALTYPLTKMQSFILDEFYEFANTLKQFVPKRTDNTKQYYFQAPTKKQIVKEIKQNCKKSKKQIQIHQEKLRIAVENLSEKLDKTYWQIEDIEEKIMYFKG